MSPRTRSLFMFTFQLFMSVILKSGQCRTPPMIEARSAGLLEKYPRSSTVVGGQTWAYEGILVQHGYPVELFCTGEPGRELSLFFIGNIEDDMLYYATDDTLFNMEPLNDITTVYYMSSPKRQFNVYTCGYGKNLLNETAELALALVVDSLPEPSDFMCVWNLGRPSIISCMWNFLNVHGEYELSFMKDGTVQGTCKMNILRNNSCTWTFLEYAGIHNYTFQLCAENGFGCVNKTYDMSSLSILRLSSPVSLVIKSKGSHHALLQWSPNAPWEVLASSNLVHKIEFSVQGMNFGAVNSTPQMISWNKYRLQIDLPCAGKVYEVKVSVKIIETDDRYWSDYSSISFFTDPAPNGTLDTNPVCQKPDIELNAPVMKYKVQNLRIEVREELVKLKKRLRPLREMVIKIRNQL